MTTSITSCPITSFIECIKQLDLRSQAYALRPVFGALNSSMIGLANRHIVANRPKPGSGVDGFNDKLNEILSKHGESSSMRDMGLEPQLDPLETISYIAGVREQLRSGVNLPDELLDLIDNPVSSLQFLSQAQQLSNQQIEAFTKLAAELGLPADVLIDSAKTTNQRDADQLRNNADEIVETFVTVTPNPDFASAPGRVKAKIIQKMMLSLERQIGVVQQSIGRSRSPARLGDIVFLQTARKEIAGWTQNEATKDVDFALALVA